MKALFQRPGDNDVFTVQGTGNGGSPILIDPTGPHVAATASQCNVIFDASVPSGTYYVTLTNIQSVLGFTMAPKTFAPSPPPGGRPQVVVEPGKTGTMRVTYAIVN